MSQTLRRQANIDAKCAAQVRLKALSCAELTRTTALRKAKAVFHFACSHLMALTLVPAILLNAVRTHFLALT